MSSVVDIRALSTRQLQLEASRAVVALGGSNHNLSKFNKLAHHDSQNWYVAVVTDYMCQYGALPSVAGPGAAIPLLLDNV